jgi:hypothetical protein
MAEDVIPGMLWLRHKMAAIRAQRSTHEVEASADAREKRGEFDTELVDENLEEIEPRRRVLAGSKR